MAADFTEFTKNMPGSMPGNIPGNYGDLGDWIEAWTKNQPDLLKSFGPNGLDPDIFKKLQKALTKMDFPATGIPGMDMDAFDFDAAAKNMKGLAPLMTAPDPAKMMTAQMELWQGYQNLWLNTTARMLGQEIEQPDVEPDEDDYRFRDAEWSESPIFNFVMQSYLLNTKWLQTLIGDVDGIDELGRMKIKFFTRMITEALAPTNFAMTNPMVVRETMRTKGQNLAQGFENYFNDLKDGFDIMRPRQTDMDAFEVGENVATAEGSVVFETPFMQLIQYAPTTEKVYQKPLLIVPPWINKFYILDLREDNSFIRWAVGKGYTVFVLSWVNPDESFADKSFDDYAAGGIFAALDAIEQATGERQVTAIGYCIGGTLMAAVLAYMAATNDDRISAVTFFAAQVDFEEAGELLVLTDETQISMLEREVRDKGYLDGPKMAATFNALRANDLIWYFVINNYLMGKQPPVFDLLFWNSDSTRFPYRLLFDYLRSLYQQNLLSKPGGLELMGEPVDLRKIEIPTYILASREDHIAPAKSVFKATQLYAGTNRFVMAGSGHIAGVINPPHKKKYQYWTTAGKKTYATFEDWSADADETPGSWWPDWHRWLFRKSGKKIAARVPGDGKLKVIEPAPGSYVKVKC
ncbi:MAG: class I poly(R)-hydroxyalkanoic acid synthase [Rhodospirillales bacterium]|nr:class I poly(R)-hydroxyalkanoic acid synthase [Rhodospirillales bacterium]